MAEPLNFLAACMVFLGGADSIEIPGVQLVQRIDHRLLVGSAPSSRSFKHLRDAGVTVILSVDGRTPDVHGARSVGLGTVHLPLGYDEIPPERIRSFSRLASEVQGTIYVHCHRGVHRGPTAAAIIWMLRSGATPGEARGILEDAGTSTRYRNLWRAVDTFEPPIGDCSDSPLPERVQVEGIAAFMIKIDLARSNLDAAGALHPDIDQQHELLMLEEYLRELGRIDPGNRTFTNGEWRDLLHSAQQAVDELSKGVTEEGLERLDAACNACHAVQRG